MTTKRHRADDITTADSGDQSLEDAIATAFDSNTDDTQSVYIPLKQRRLAAERKLRQSQGLAVDDAGESQQHEQDESKSKGMDDSFAEASSHQLSALQAKSLVDIAFALRAERSNAGIAEETEADREQKEELELVQHLNKAQAPLQGLKQAATGVKSIGTVKRSWQPSQRITQHTESDNDIIRQKQAIIVEGDNLPPPCPSFRAMRFPQPMLQQLKAKNILKPSPIQCQGLPTVLSGRDMIGIASTGSGKTIVFALPLIMLALEYEIHHQLQSRQGPIGIILCPSRELAKQIADVITEFTTALYDSGVWPQLHTLLSIGGISFTEQQRQIDAGVHMIVATPGRLLDLLNKKKLTLERCSYLAMDEADRLIDLGFEDDIRQLFDYFTGPRQTVLFSATMPPKIQDFALSALNEPIVVNVGRAGAANLDVIQEVEYVKPESKLSYLLECLQKTAPPVLIFASNQTEVDEIHEFLLRKGVDAVGVHGGKPQAERSAAIEAFKVGKADVLVATDVASKGLDFTAIQHVINYDMPREIEDYVHRIGRTGRSGKTGVATTFVNRDQCGDSILLDLKHLLREAKQRVPPLLNSITDPNDDWEERVAAAEAANKAHGVKAAAGCAYCGGLGHRVMNCPKLAGLNKNKMLNSYGYDRMDSALE